MLPSGSVEAAALKSAASAAVPVAWWATATATGGWLTSGKRLPMTSISESPTLFVESLAASTLSDRLVMVRLPRSRVRPLPSLGRAPVVRVLPSLNVSVAAVIWSSRFGRSWRTMLLTETGHGQLSVSHAPAF